MKILKCECDFVFVFGRSSIDRTRMVYGPISVDTEHVMSRKQFNQEYSDCSGYFRRHHLIGKKRK